MRSHSLLLTAPRQLRWYTEELPAPQPHEVLVQTLAGAISIGAELPQFLGTARSALVEQYPRMTGYESIGRVVACGTAVQCLHIGDRVVAFYGHRTFALLPEAKAIIVPDGLSDAIALLLILSCDAAKGIWKLAIHANTPVLVTGAGTMGLLTTFVLKNYGVQTIDVVEPRVERRTLALQFGARRADTMQAFIQESDMYPLGFECSSHNAAFELLQRKMSHSGSICILADGNREPLELSPAFHEKELSIVGSSDGWNYQEHAKWYFGLGIERLSILKHIFDYHIQHEALIESFEQLAEGSIMPVKILVQYRMS